MSAVPRYDIDLDLPPMERWRAPVAAHKEQIHKSLSEIDKQIKEMGTTARIGVNLAGGYMRGAGATGAIMYYDEICAIAELADLPLGRLIALQLQYEAAAMCTSVVVSSKNLHPATSPVLVRTMDWDMEFLKPLTVQLTFHRSGRPLFVCTTWVGYVGVLTGMALRGNPNNFGISVNYRMGGPGWGGVLSNLRTRWPIAFLVRHVLENAATYEQCVMMLRTSKLISPVYFTVCGGRPHQGCLITREKKHDENFWALDTHGPIVQANNDHYATHVPQDIMGSVYRSQYVRSQVGLAAQRFDEALAAAKATPGADAVTTALDRSLWRLISEPRVCEDITIYGTAMVPALGYYDTRVPEQVQVPLGDGRAQVCYALFRETPLDAPLDAATA